MGVSDRARDALFSSIDLIERHLRRPRLIVFHDRAYRIPFPSLDRELNLDPRRADFVVWCLGDYRVARGKQIRRPPLVSDGELALVHTPEHLASLSQAETLARIFAVDPTEVPVEETLRMVRTACGGTIEAARLALSSNCPTLNTLGGFHHAAPNHGGGFCAVNDIAVAVAVLRGDGYRGPINVLDLDAHPPDGIAECLRSDGATWIGSLSAADWGPMAGVDETVLPPDSGDDQYLAGLDSLLGRMPLCGLAFVIAGGDVLAGDRLGRLGLTLEGARRRDLRVAERLGQIPSVWLPGGGYHPQTWKILAQVGFILAGRTRARIPPYYDPSISGDGQIGRGIQPGHFAEEPLTLEELEQSLWKRSPDQPRLLGLYSREGLERSLSRYGMTAKLERLGYSDIRFEAIASAGGDAIRLLGSDQGKEHALIEAVLERRRISEWEFLFVNWLALRHPRAGFTPARPRLPGQDAPGLGLAREMVELLAQLSHELNLDGVAFRPSWYHTAFSVRDRGRFVEAKRQGRFEALTRDLAGIPLLEATNALAEGRVKLNGQPYSWEPDDMAYWNGKMPPDDDVVVAEREGSHFAIAPR
jgi:acetoin utilization deacetylase AcuC-like enzyme